MGKKGKINLKEPRLTIAPPLRPRRYKYLFLVVCEDQKTEPAYLQQFKSRIPPETMFLGIAGIGRDAFGVIEFALKERDILQQELKREVDKIFAVFDVDDSYRDLGKSKRFNTALELAQANQIQLAVSNEVFELWLLLHLAEVDPSTPMDRKLIYVMLETEIKNSLGYDTFEYKHGETKKLFKAINELGSQTKAVQRAKVLDEHFKGSPILETNPRTHVYKLVTELEEWIAYYTP